MLDWIIASALRHRVGVVLVACVLMTLGAFTALRLPIDVLPDLDRPQVTLLTDAHGMAAESAERLVTRPLEQVMTGAPGVVGLRSTSGPGLSLVQVLFDWGTDPYRNRQVVQEKLSLVRAQLPADVQPTLAPLASLMGQIQFVGVRSRDAGTDLATVRALVDQLVKPRLLAVPGIAQVAVAGGAPRQLQVEVDATRLQALGITLVQVRDAITAANQSASGGILALGTQGPAVTVRGLLQDPAELARAVVRPDPARPIRIGDVAEVAFGPAAVRMGEAGVNGGPGVVIAVTKQPGIDTLALTGRIDGELRELASALPHGIEFLPQLFRQADFIERAVHNVLVAVRDGAFLVTLVLLLFLWNLRTTFITLTALPLSIALTALVFTWCGVSINTMTLGGLAVAIGTLVDDAIVDVENVFRRLRQERQRAAPRPALQVVFAASSEVRKPILIGTLLVIAVYLPLFGLSGMEGRLFTPIGVAYITSILASLLVALTVTPVLCVYLLPEAPVVRSGRESAVVRAVKAWSGRVVGFGLDRAVPVATACASLVLVGTVVLFTRGSEFLPSFQEGSAQVNLFLPPGTGLGTADAYGRRLEQAVLTVPGVASVARRTGRAEGDDHVMGIEVSEAVVALRPDLDRPRAEVLADLRTRVGETFPGAAIEVEQPLAHLLSHMLSGSNAQVAIQIRGPDLALLRRLAAQARAAVAAVPGVTDLVVEPLVLVDQIEVLPDRDRLARLGLKVEDVAQVVALALEGGEVSRLQLREFSHPIVMRLRAEDRRDPAALGRLLVAGAGATAVPLETVADVQRTRAANEVRREDGMRRILVQHNVQGRALGTVVAEVERALVPVRSALPAGYSLRIRGQHEAQQDATRVIAGLSLLSFLAMVGLVFLHFRDWNLTLQTLLSLPMAFLGAVAFVVAFRQNLSLATLVGLISLAGLAARNKILLIDHYLHLMREEGESFGRAMIVRAGQERAIPVLMTALSSGIALVPLLLAPGEPGREILHPVATVIVGGLISSTLLDLLLTPGVFWLFGQRAAEHAARLRERESQAFEPGPEP
ncbi:MAG: efflux RND transporter permease subunit [Planctomycetes bacterium]|nr:efflux RND transporter permease subunit [Planctomycetota bacterium]